MREDWPSTTLRVVPLPALSAQGGTIERIADRRAARAGRGGRHLPRDARAPGAPAGPAVAPPARALAGRRSRSLPGAVPQGRAEMALVLAAGDGRRDLAGEGCGGPYRARRSGTGKRAARARLPRRGRMPDPLPRPGAGTGRARPWPLAVRRSAGARLAAGRGVRSGPHLQPRPSGRLARLSARRLQGQRPGVRELSRPAPQRPAAARRGAANPFARLGKDFDGVGVGWSELAADPGRHAPCCSATGCRRPPALAGGPGLRARRRPRRAGGGPADAVPKRGAQAKTVAEVSPPPSSR